MRPRRQLRRCLILAALATVTFPAPAQALQLGPESPHSPNAEDIETTYWVMLIVALLLIAAVHVALLGAVVRFRDRRGRRPARVTAARRVVARAAAAFALVAVVAFVFAVVMTRQARTVEESGPRGLGASTARFAQVGVEGLPSAQPPSAIGEQAPGEEPATAQEGNAPLEIDVIGQQWLWRFEYPGEQPPGQQIFSYGELVVPVDTTVVLDITSTDVIHGWWIPALGGQVQAVPGQVSQTWFKADETGVYGGSSAVFNGTGFPAMRAWVRVVSPERYQSYLDGLERDLRESQSIVQRQVAQGATETGGTP